MIRITLTGKYSLKINLLLFKFTKSGRVEETWAFRNKWSGVRTIDLPGPFDALVSLENERLIFSLKFRNLTIYETSANLEDLIDRELPISLNKRGFRFEGSLVIDLER